MRKKQTGEKDNAGMQERTIVTGPQPPDAQAAPVHTVRVEPLGRHFAAAPGQPLLRAAEDAGIELPSSCRNGTCRSCLCRRTAGESRHLIDWPGLSAEEKAEGWILPCVAEACSDLLLDVPNAFLLFDE